MHHIVERNCCCCPLPEFSSCCIYKYYYVARFRSRCLIKLKLDNVLPVLSAQLMTAPTGRPREMRNFAPAVPPRPVNQTHMSICCFNTFSTFYRNTRYDKVVTAKSCEPPSRPDRLDLDGRAAPGSTVTVARPDLGQISQKLPRFTALKVVALFGCLTALEASQDP